MYFVIDDNNTMISAKPSAEVSVQILDFDELISQCAPLMLDTYQRPCVWDEGNVTQLLQGFADFINQGSLTTGQYYLGTLMLHPKTESTQLRKSESVWR